MQDLFWGDHYQTFFLWELFGFASAALVCKC